MAEYCGSGQILTFMGRTITTISSTDRVTQRHFQVQKTLNILWRELEEKNRIMNKNKNKMKLQNDNGVFKDRIQKNK